MIVTEVVGGRCWFQNEGFADPFPNRFEKHSYLIGELFIVVTLSNSFFTSWKCLLRVTALLMVARDISVVILVAVPIRNDRDQKMESQS